MINFRSGVQLLVPNLISKQILSDIWYPKPHSFKCKIIFFPIFYLKTILRDRTDNTMQNWKSDILSYFQISERMWFEICFCTRSGRRRSVLKFIKNSYVVTPPVESREGRGWKYHWSLEIINQVSSWLSRDNQDETYLINTIHDTSTHDIPLSIKHCQT